MMGTLKLTGAGSPAMPARRRKPQTMALFDAVQRRAGLLDFKQPLQPPRRGMVLFNERRVAKST